MKSKLHTFKRLNRSINSGFLTGFIFNRIKILIYFKYKKIFKTHFLKLLHLTLLYFRFHSFN